MRSVIFQISVLISLLLTVSSAQAQTPSALDFVKPHEYGKMAISPDGRYGAIPKVTTKKYCLDRFKTKIAKLQQCSDKSKRYKTTNQVLVYDLLENKVDQVVNISGSGHISSFEFAKNRRLVFCQSELRTSGTVRWGTYTFPSSDCVAVSVGEEQNLRPPSIAGIRSDFPYGVPGVLSPLDNDSDYVIARPVQSRFYGTLKRRYVYEADKKEKRESSKEAFSDDEKTFHIVTDTEGTELVRVACDRKKTCKSIEIYYRQNADSKWEIIRKIEADESLGFITEVFFPFAVDQENGQIFTVSRESESKRKSVRMFDPKTKTFTKTVVEHSELDIERLLFDPISKKFQGAVFKGSENEYFVQNGELKKHYEFLQRKFGKGTSFEVVNNNLQGERALVYASSPSTPGKYFLYNPDTQSLKLALDRNGTLSKQINSDANMFKIKTRDGASIDAYHYFPNGKAKGAPLIIMPHGGPHARDYFDYDSWVQFFVSKGYQVVQMNFRGSTGYGIEHETAGFGEWGGLMQDDVTDTVKYLHENGYAKPEQTCIVGYSYGGYAALYGGASTPELYSCIVSGGGVADLVRSMKDDRVRFADQTYSYLQQSVGDLREKDNLKDKSPTRMADNFQAPVLLIHGDNDTRVPPLHSRRMKDALEDAGKSVTYLELEEAGHDGWTLENEILYLETIAAFLGKHIGK